jgi:hypothetical protein
MRITGLIKLNWIAHVFTPLALILMETLWVYPWLVFLGKWPALVAQRPPLNLISLIVLLGGAFFLTKIFLSRKWHLHWIQFSIITCGAVAIFVVLRIEYGSGFTLLDKQWFVHNTRLVLDGFSHPHPIIFALPVCFYLWWKGIRWGRSPLYFTDVYHAFLLGLIALVLLVIAWGITSGVGSTVSLTSMVGIQVAGFFFFGLAAMALTNLRVIQERMRAGEVNIRGFSRRWVSIILGVIGGIVLLGIAFASIFSAQFVSFLGRALSLISDLLYQLVYYASLPIGYLVAGLYYIWQFIINLFTHGQSPQFTQPMEGFKLEQSIQNTQGALSPEAILAIKWTLLTLVLGGIIFLLVRSIVRYRSNRAKDEVDEENESLWSWEGFKADLRLFLSGLRRKKQPLIVIPQTIEQEEIEIQQTLSIREIYRLLLLHGARNRMSRQRQETPDEYARRLGQAITVGSEPLGELTRLYIEVRYGEIEVESNNTDYANSLWRTLRGLLVKPESWQNR